MINLLPKEEKDTIVRIRRTRFTTLACTFLFYIGIIASIAMLPSYLLSLEKEKNIIEVYESLQTEESTKETNSLNEVVKDINQKLSVLPGNQTKTFSSEFFGPIIENKGDLILIDRVSYGKNAEGLFVGHIQGVAKTRTSLLSFVDKLKTTPQFEGVSVPISDLVKDRDIVFNLEFTLP